MSSEVEFNNNGNGDLINIIYPGIRANINSLVSRNSQFFAYTTALSIYVYEQKTLNIVNIITRENHIISTISFATKNPQLIAVSYNSRKVEVINVVDNTLICNFTTEHPIVSFGWSKQDTELICFTRFYSQYNIFSSTTGKKIKSVSGFFDNIRVLAITDSDDPIFFGGNYVGTVSRFYKGKGKSVQFEGRNNVVAATFDPNNQTQCLIVWKQSWGLFDASSDIKLIHEVTDLSYSLSSATWSSFIPGQFFTGDEVTGNIRVWNGPSTVPLEIINVYTSGVTSLIDLKSNKLLIGFADGMVGVYDVENRKFIFQNLSGHTGAIFDLKFHPANPDVFITAGREGSICTWNATTFKQIDRITSYDSHDHFNSMDVSPGGGMISCGFVNGTIAFFSLQTMSKIYEYKLCQQTIIQLKFSQFEPELIIASSIQGFCCIFNVQEKKIVWKVPSKLRSSVGAFSIHNKGQIIVSTDNGSILIFNGMKEQPDEIIDDLSKPRFFKIFFSPFDKDIILTTENEGLIKIINLKSKTIEVLSTQTERSWSIVFHPFFEKIVAIASLDGLVRMYNIETKKPIWRFEAHTSPVLSIGFSPSNPNLFVTAASDSSIKLWSINSLFYKTYLKNLIDQKFEWMKPIEGQSQLMKLARRCMKLDDKFMYRSDDVSHINDILRITKKTVQKAMSGSIKETSIIRRAVKNKERMIQSAKQELFMGNAKHYCELMFASGNFDLAVAASPAVSVNFWIEMMKNRAKLFDNKNEAANCLLSIGDVNGAIEKLNEDKDFNNAFLISAANIRNSFKFEIRDSHPQTFSIKRPYIDLAFNQHDIFNEYRTGHEMAKKYLENGQIYFASAAYLSVGDIVNAELLLMTHGETPSAFVFDSMTKTKNIKVIERFVMLAVQTGIDKETIIKLFSSEEDLEIKKRIVLSLPFSSASERESFYDQNGLKKPSEYIGGESEVEKLHFLLLSGNQTEASNFLISFAKDNLNTNYSDVEEMVRLFELTYIDSSLNDKNLFSIISLSLYFAIYRALWKGYMKVIKRLHSKFSECILKNQIDFMKEHIEETNKAIQLFKPTNEKRIKYVGFNYLNPKSIGEKLNHESMLGKQYILEDNNTKIDMEEALMWFDLTPFSPLTLKAKHCII